VAAEALLRAAEGDEYDLTSGLKKAFRVEEMPLSWWMMLHRFEEDGK